jgi:transcription-repair coupling factor (superfamily II helicase)
VAARRAGLTDITAAGSHIRFTPVELPDSRQVRVQRLYPKTVLKPTVRTMLVPVPKTAAFGGQPLRDTELLTWCGEVVRSVLADLAPGVLFHSVPRSQGPAYRRDAQ